MLTVITLNVVMLSVIMLSDAMLNVIILNVIMLNVLAPTKQLGIHQKSVAKYINKYCIFFNLVKHLPKNIPRILNLCIFFAQLQWLLSDWYFCDFSQHKSCKTYLRTMLPPRRRNWQLIYHNLQTWRLFFVDIPVAPTMETHLFFGCVWSWTNFS